MRKRSRLVGAGLLSALTAGSLALAAAPAGAIGGDPEPTDPCDTATPPSWCQELATFEPPANGFSWSVPKRFTGTVADFHWDAANARYDANHVHPATWPADFDACRTAEDAERAAANQPTVNTYSWSVAGSPVSGTSCRMRHNFPDQGTFDVRVTVSGPDAAGPFSQQVTIRDIVVVSLGDSAASGEGNPDVPRNGDQPAQWVDRRCHRSAKSGPAKAAAALEASDPHTSVTFLSFACSGASINRSFFDPFEGQDFYTQDLNKPAGQGILEPYRGTEGATPFLPSQMDQLRTAITCTTNALTCPNGQRRVDSLVLSAGINDLGFGPIVATCLREWACENPQDYTVTGTDGRKVSLPTRFNADAAMMKDRYLALSNRLMASGLNIARTYITQYPNPTTKDDGTLCPEILEDVAMFHHADAEETAWLGGTALGTLNKAVEDAAKAHGWVLVDGISSAFVGHGYCATDGQRWIQRASESKAMQGPDDTTKTTGTLHPNEAGHNKYATHILNSIKPDIAQLPVDSVMPDAPGNRDIVLTGGAGWRSVPVARANGNGTFTISNPDVGDFGGWATAPNVKRLTGDFNGDGLTDIALTGGAGWNTLPVAMANAGLNGGFTVTNHYVGEFAAWAATPNVRTFANDVDRNGRTDIALTGGAGWRTLPVALSNGDGGFSVRNSYVGDFAGWAAPSSVRVLPGDYNGDGYGDFALTGGPGWNTLPVAFSAPGAPGSFSVTNSYVGAFATWAQPESVRVSAADFNGDRRTDLVLNGASASALPMARSNGNGSFTVTNIPVDGFASWSYSASVKVTTGDFNRDGRADLALTGGAGWSTLPVALSLGNGGFTVNNGWVGEFAGRAASANAKVVAGDYNGDGLTDLAVTGIAGYAHMPVAFANGGAGFWTAGHPVPSFATMASATGVTAHSARLSR